MLYQITLQITNHWISSLELHIINLNYLYTIVQINKYD